MPPSGRKPTRSKSKYGDTSGVIRRMKRKYPEQPQLTDAMRYRLLAAGKSPQMNAPAMMKYRPVGDQVFYSTAKRKQTMLNVQNGRKTKRSQITREPPSTMPLHAAGLAIQRYNINLPKEYGRAFPTAGVS